VVLIAAEQWTRTPRLLPRGPWREGTTALARAGVVLVTRKSASAERAEQVAKEVTELRPGVAVAICHLAPDGLAPLHGGDPRPLESIRGEDVIAVAGLAQPEPFFDALRSAGARVESIVHPDHHPFTAEDARCITRRAAGRPIVMTHKDAVKLRDLIPSSENAMVLEQAVRIERGGDVLDAALRRALEGGHG
jgi:tetraacyldisaccharide 4'-kinase